jgi:ABC-2 type transport system permease protein
MRWHRIKAVMLHAWHHMLHSRETWVDIGWFPIVNTLSIGGLTMYFAGQAQTQEALFPIVALVMWYVIEVGNYSIAIGALWEIWARSFSSLFISPLRVEEFVVGHILFSVLKQVLILSILFVITSVLFHISPLVFGPVLPIYLVLLALYGWAFGMFVFGLILRFGTSLQSLSWGLIFALQPLIGIYYPVEVLPTPVRLLADFIGPTHVYHSARHQFLTGVPLWSDLSRALVIDLVALMIGYIFMKMMWERARRAGTLARMEE